MAGSNDPPSPSRQHPEADNAYDDDWRQAEDDDLPTLISSIEQDAQTGPQDNADSRIETEADEAILNDIVSGTSGQSSPDGSQRAFQQAPPKMLTRPISSGKDPAAGFAFTKAKPIQQLDFRRLKQATIIPQSPGLPRPSEGAPTETYSHQSPPSPDITQAVDNAVENAAYQSPLPKHHDAPAPKDNHPVPSSNAMPAQFQAYTKPMPTTASGPITLNFSSTNTRPNESSPAADVTLIDSDSNGAKAPPLLNIVIPNRNKPNTTTVASTGSSAETNGFLNQPQVNKQGLSDKVSRDPLSSVVGAPKVTNPRRRKTQVAPHTIGHPPPSNPKSTYTEDDLLRLLMYRRQQGQQELEYFKSAQNQKEAEILGLRKMSSNLSNELQEVSERETQKTAELSRLKAKLEGAQQSVKQERLRSQILEDDSRHRIETLTQTVQRHGTQLRSDENLLIAERERNKRLEDQVSRINTTHEQLLQVFTSHRDDIVGKIDNLQHQAKSIVLPTKTSEPHPQDQVGPMLEKCIEMLQQLQEADTVKSADLGQLGNTVDSFVKGITISIENCEENFTSIGVGQKQLEVALQDQLRALGGTISSEHALSEQIRDLREMRATLRERLQATENSLADARREVVALRLKDQEQSRRVVALESDVAKAQSQPAVSPQALLHIQELDFRNRDLQNEVVTLNKEAASLSNQLQQTSTGTKEVTERLAATQEKLAATQEEVARSREECLASERQATLEREQLRQDLSETAKIELADQEREHMSAIQQLNLEKSGVEENLKRVAEQSDMLKAEKEVLENESSTLQALLNRVRSEKEAVIGTRKALQLHLEEMEVRMNKKNLESGDMQAMLKKANDQVKAKDLEIAALRASQAARISTSRVPEQAKIFRGAQSSGSGHTLHRGSQQALIDNSPSIRPASSKSSRHFTKRHAVVEDSQPAEKPSFVSLDDLILEDPFADYTQEGPHTIAGEKISHLFPSTPGAGSPARDVDYSRKSVFHTTVVSETQRRQHPLLREATPHAGTHAMIKPRSLSQARAYSRDGQINAVPRSSVAPSITKVNFSRSEPTNTSSQGKRNIVAAGFSDTKSQAPPSKVHKAGPAKPAKALGPVIEDSQSPRLNGRSRKMTRRKSSAPKVDKFARRFAQE